MRSKCSSRGMPLEMLLQITVIMRCSGPSTHQGTLYTLVCLH